MKLKLIFVALSLAFGGCNKLAVPMSEEKTGRYQVVSGTYDGRATFVKIDTATGTAWELLSSGKGNAGFWSLIR